MITLERNGWRVTRRIGVGDRELVRSGLLQIGLMCKDHTAFQVAEALTAALRVKKTLRVYLNASRLSHDEINHLVYSVMGRARDHDIMVENNPTRCHFDWVLGRCDIIVERTNSGDPSTDELASLIKEVWLSSNGRHYLNEQTWRKTEEQVKEMFPEMFADDDRLWELWSN